MPLLQSQQLGSRSALVQWNQKQVGAGAVETGNQLAVLQVLIDMQQAELARFLGQVQAQVIHQLQ